LSGAGGGHCVVEGLDLGELQKKVVGKKKDKRGKTKGTGGGERRRREGTWGAMG